mmetsp:Transcript_59424/g.121743  ORF Transcript_59424/g.121743 Transcript_59424/m.121743 type:complete len:272 (+) Transcript_59424:1373-2188(+)
MPRAWSCRTLRSASFLLACSVTALQRRAATATAALPPWTKAAVESAASISPTIRRQDAPPRASMTGPATRCACVTHLCTTVVIASETCCSPFRFCLTASTAIIPALDASLTTGQPLSIRPNLRRFRLRCLSSTRLRHSATSIWTRAAQWTCTSWPFTGSSTHNPRLTHYSRPRLHTATSPWRPRPRRSWSKATPAATECSIRMSCGTSSPSTPLHSGLWARAPKASRPLQSLTRSTPSSLGWLGTCRKRASTPNKRSRLYSSLRTTAKTRS